jgi:hypothetical protein
VTWPFHLSGLPPEQASDDGVTQFPPSSHLEELVLLPAKCLVCPVRRISWLFALTALVAAAVGCSTKEVARSDLPIESDFSECEGWSTDDDEHILLSCEEGQYRVLYRDVSEQIHDYMVRRTAAKVDSVGIEADITFRNEPGTSGKRFLAAGLMCLISGVGEPSKGYWFALDPERDGAILRVDETNKNLQGQFFLEPLVDEPALSAVKEVGQANHVRAECRRSQSGGADLSMWVNGVRVADKHDPTGVFGYEAFGFSTAATESGTEFRFDNFLTEELHAQG